MPKLLFCIVWIGVGLMLSGCGEAASSPQAQTEEAGLPEIRFTDVTSEAGLGDFRHENGAAGDKWFPEQMGAGGGFIDYDGDGWLDLLLIAGGVWPDQADQAQPGLRLYRNQNGAFTDVTEAAGLADVRAFTIGLAAADYDNDGDEDLYVTTLHRNLFFRNEGGTFTEIGEVTGVADQAVWSSSPIFFDADRDGHLDLYVGNYAHWTPEEDIWCTLDGKVKEYCSPNVYTGVSSRYYHNNGDGTFAERTEAAGFLHDEGKSLGAAELDFNRDGFSDLVVANDGEGDLLYKNNGDGTFDEIGVVSGFAFGENGEARAGMGIDVGVVDETGEPSVFVGNFSHEMVGVYRHGENGWFLDRAAVSRIGHPTLLKLTFGLFLFDVEFDGDLDLFVGNGHVYPSVEATEDNVKYRQPQQLFLNRGDGTFEEVGERLGGVWAKRLVTRGAAYADYDQDGDLDILITESGGPVHLWRNDLEDATFLRVRLTGTESNRDALGSRIMVEAGDLKMERRVRTGSSYLSQIERVATFGLDGAERVDRLTIQWPSGRVDTFEDVPANQELHITEGEIPSVLASR